MTATNHVITGAIIGAVVHQPALAIPAAFASHFVCDAIPHFGNGKTLPFGRHGFILYLLIDCGLAAVILLSLIVRQPAHWPLMVVCGIAAASPDLMWLPRFVGLLRHKKDAIGSSWLMRFHAVIQWSQTPAGLLVEIAWLVILGSVLKRYY